MPKQPHFQENQIGQVQVVDGEVTPDDEGALFERSNDSIWLDYVVHNRYEYDPHRYMGGVTSPGGFNGARAAFFQLAAPNVLWIADWTAYKAGDTPEVPDPEPSDPDWVFLGAFPAEAGMLTVAPDGTTGRFRLSGTYVYGHRNPPGNVWDLVTFGKPPWLRGGSLPRRITTDKLQHAIVDDAGDGGAGDPAAHQHVLGTQPQAR